MAPLFLRKRHITRRVEALMKEVSMSKVRLIFSLAAMLLILAATGHFSAWSFPMQGAGQVPDKRVYRVGDGVIAPKLTSKVEPEYTEEARDAKIEGTVVLLVEIHPDGRAHNIRVIRSLDAGLDKKAAEAIENGPFNPARKTASRLPWPQRLRSTSARSTTRSKFPGGASSHISLSSPAPTPPAPRACAASLS
jgi:TonB family protein